MFVRAKTIKGKKYAYLVKNQWKKGKVKQHVKKYLGPIVEIPPKSEVFSPIQINFDEPSKECIRNIISNEFISRGFIRKQARLIFEDIVISFANNKVTKGESECVLFINDRYLSGFALDDLQNFFAPESTEDRPGKKLAQTFSDAGIPVSQEEFINLYKKIYLHN
ncbi:hypothetical protein JXA48_01195 [Candidatus Woesearchaeota archaeon]|nr:hypothetical protein [Candidatus Woesearchaeota archaeon]